MKYFKLAYLAAVLLAASCTEKAGNTVTSRALSPLAPEAHSERKNLTGGPLVVVSDRNGVCLPKEFASGGTFITRRGVTYSYGEYVFVENEKAHTISFSGDKTVGPPGIKLDQSEAIDPARRYFAGAYGSTRVLKVESANADEGLRFWFEFNSDDQAAEKETWRLARALVKCEIVAVEGARNARNCLARKAPPAQRARVDIRFKRIFTLAPFLHSSRDK